MSLRDKNMKINVDRKRFRKKTNDNRSSLPPERPSVEKGEKKIKEAYRERSPISTPIHLIEDDEKAKKPDDEKEHSYRKIEEEDENIVNHETRNEEASERETPETNVHSEVNSEDTAASGENDQEVAEIMGFSGFSSTSGSHVQGAKGGGSKIESKSQYRRYMNRKKGFNRPLSPTR